jgi:hypothetical protein
VTYRSVPPLSLFFGFHLNFGRRRRIHEGVLRPSAGDYSWACGPPEAMKIGVTAAKAGAHCGIGNKMDSRFRGNDAALDYGRFANRPYQPDSRQ